MNRVLAAGLRIEAEKIRALRIAGIWRNRTLAEDARERAAQEPERICIRDPYRAISYRDILREAEGLAAGLRALGLVTGDVMSFQLPNWIEAAVIDIAASLLGLVVNPIVPIYREHETTAILEDCGARILFVPDTFRNFDHAAMGLCLRRRCPALEHVVVVKAAAAPPREGLITYESLANTSPRSMTWPATAPESIKFVLYTSGTTGVAKGVLHTHETIARVLQGCMEFWRIEPQDPILMPSPVTHITGFLWGLEAPFCWGSPTVLMERWSADDAIDLMERHAVAMTISATTFLQELLDAAERRGKDLPTLKAFACGGASVPPALIHRANRMLRRCRSFRVYGATEVPLIGRGCVDPTDDATAAETDGIIVDFEVSIRLHCGSPAADGQEGEILARGPAQCLGYVDAEATRAAFDADGYFHTGDLGYRTPRGALVITGRKKDLIIRGGENISPKEIEDLLILHPAVCEIAVVSMPHARLGEAVCAFVISRNPGLTLRDLVGHLEKAGMARQKFPERLELVEDLPRTAAGKIKKDLLRATAARLVAA